MPHPTRNTYDHNRSHGAHCDQKEEGLNGLNNARRQIGLFAASARQRFENNPLGKVISQQYLQPFERECSLTISRSNAKKIVANDVYNGAYNLGMGLVVGLVASHTLLLGLAGFIAAAYLSTTPRADLAPTVGVVTGLAVALAYMTASATALCFTLVGCFQLAKAAVTLTAQAFNYLSESPELIANENQGSPEEQPSDLRKVWQFCFNELPSQVQDLASEYGMSPYRQVQEAQDGGRGMTPR